MSPLAVVRGGLVVSCQAYPGEALRFPEAMAAMALAAVRGGAAGIRAQGPADVAAISAATDLPLIGLWKDGEDDVRITPTLDHARRIARAGAGIVAVDGTRRPRPDGLTFAQVVSGIHEAGALVLADCGSAADAEFAAEAGADAVATSLAGYTGERPATPGPDLELVAELVRLLDVPVLAEGRIRTPEEAREALDIGAWAVVVGTAITHPASITSRFVDALHPEPHESRTRAG